jgi:UDP-N-acetylmuramoyl-tripeptide--D-alanyl-D-alanine ligase
MIESLYRKFIGSTGVSTDTRSMKEGNLFFALTGPNFDANKFADEALGKGASFAVIDNPELRKDDRYVVVENTLNALQELAIFHRKHHPIPFIGITGSNGKTTTKELVNAVLSTRYQTIATKGNLNNHIGVPLTVLSVTADTEIAIIEMGANKPGDIRDLCLIADPGFGIITNIGKAHIEGFGSFEGVLRTKTELFDYLIKRKGKVFINSVNPILANLIKRFTDPVLYPGSKDFYHCELVKADPYITYRGEDGVSIDTKLIGTYNFDNISAALCIGKYFQIDPAAAHQAISGYVPSNMRSQVIPKGSNLVILDAYNANPSSMEAALKTLSQMPLKHKVAILGDMLELGNISESEHKLIGKITLENGIDEVIFCGTGMAMAHQANNKSKYFKARPALEEYLDQHHFVESAILIKASRGMQFESLIHKIH